MTSHSPSTIEIRRKLVGWRFSGADAVALVIFGATAVALRIAEFPMWWIVPFAVLHFFLFCNIFRVRRNLEITCAGLFILNVTGWFLAGRDGWLFPLLSQLPATIAVIAWEMRSPAYHGILAERLNPQLNEYLAARLQRPAS
jgi:hypothetical protein